MRTKSRPGSPAVWQNGGETKGWPELEGASAKGCSKKGGRGGQDRNPVSKQQRSHWSHLRHCCHRSNFRTSIERFCEPSTTATAATAAVPPSVADHPNCSEEQDVNLEVV